MDRERSGHALAKDDAPQLRRLPHAGTGRALDARQHGLRADPAAYGRVREPEHGFAAAKTPRRPRARADRRKALADSARAGGIDEGNQSQHNDGHSTYAANPPLPRIARHAGDHYP